MRSTALGIFAALTVLVWGSLAGAASPISLGAPNSGGEVVQVAASEGPGGAIVLDYAISGFQVDPVLINSETYYQVTMGEEARTLDAGAPELPVICRSVIIPDRAEMAVRVVSSSYRDFGAMDVVPSKGNLLRTVDPATVPYQFGQVYTTDAWYPEQIATSREPYILRDFRGLTVVVNPIQYNPATHTLRVYDHLVIEVMPVGESNVNVIDRVSLPPAMNADFIQIYTDHFLNFTQDRYAPITEVGQMLVIAYDNFMANMQPFVDWKNAMGVPTTLVAKSAVGTDGNAFRTYIQNYYNAHNDLAFVLLVGDLAQIPSLSYAGAPADPMFSLVRGSDSYPDIFIGRFSAETAEQVNVQVLKSVEYESLVTADTHWYRRGVGIGSGEGVGIGDDGEGDWQHIDNIRTDLLNFTYTGVDTIYAHSPYQATAQMVTNAVNDGRSIIDYCGHGSTTAWSTTGFSNSHVAALVNYNKLPWIVSVACVNGAFQSGTCFAEAWLRAFKDGEPTGAVGMYASTVNMSWAPPMAAQDETIDLLVAQEKRTVGALCYSGSCQMIDEYGGSGVGEFNNWHIFGDPSLRARSAAPAAMVVQHETFIEQDATAFAVTVPGVAGALCGLSCQGVFHGSAFTDGAGSAVIPVVGALPSEGQVTLTVTSFNKIPYVAALDIGQPALPQLMVDPLEFTFEVPIGETLTDYLTITNVGMEGSNLTYNVYVQPVSPSMWLHVSPGNGECGYQEADVIEVTVDTHNLQTGDYTAKIVVQTNAGTVNVPVTLTAGDASAVGGREMPTVLSLQAAGPNPFSSSTRVSFGLPQAGQAELGVYDMSGRLVRTLLSGSQKAGFQIMAWDGRDDADQRMPAGVYFYKLNAGGHSLTERVMLLR